MDGRILDALFATIKTRKGADPEKSWTAKLFKEAPELPAQKLSEETAEAVIEALRGDTKALTKEAADILYHLLVVLAASDVEVADVWDELERRCGQSGIDEKQARR